MKEKVILEDGDEIVQPNLFENLFTDMELGVYSCRIEKIRYLIEMKRAERIKDLY